MKRLFAIGVILLFIGLLLSPSIHAKVSKESINSELVELSVEVFGIDEIKTHTLKLTKQQYAEVEILLNDIQMKLESIKTMKDAVPIFYDAVVELNKYGLLPEGMDVESAQKLVTGGYKHSEEFDIFRETENASTNALCFIIALIFDTFKLDYLSPFMLVILLMSLPIIIVEVILTLLIGFPVLPGWLFAIILNMMLNFPLGLMSVIKMNGNVHGVISTLGLLGYSKFGGVERYIKGIIAGFTGIKIWRHYDCWLIGFSVYTNIEYV